MAERIFKRGEIYWVNIEENEKEDKETLRKKPKRSETQKNRPGVIISNDKQNQFSGAVIVTLITSQVDKVYFFEVELEIEKKPSKILTDQIYTVDKGRLERKIGILNEKQLKKLARGLHTVLELKDCNND
jgi:mRNA interferase MazF